MKILFYINRLNKLDKLIREQKTGTPQILAKRLHISKSRLYCILDDLRLQGVPIEYCRKRETYIYKKPFKIEASLTLTDLSKEEAQKILGGFFITPFFVYWQKRTLQL